ncbi:hypothetical protein [Staphylococcus sp. 11261D007BR]
MNKTIKTLVNVIPIFLVPLVLERKKFKKHPDVQKATQATVDTSKTVAHKTGDISRNVKDAVVTRSGKMKDKMVMKKRRRDYNKAMKKEAAYQEQMRPENVRARGNKIQKENRKEVSKLNKKLNKSIEKRHKTEDKIAKSRQKRLQKNMQKMQSYEAKLNKLSRRQDLQDASQSTQRITTLSELQNNDAEPGKKLHNHGQPSDDNRKSITRATKK